MVDFLVMVQFDLGQLYNSCFANLCFFGAQYGSYLAPYGQVGPVVLDPWKL